MRQVSLAVAKDKLSEYAAAAAAGEEITITRHGRPYARLVAAEPGDEERKRLKRKIANDLRRLNRSIVESGQAMSLDEVVDMINEDRR